MHNRFALFALFTLATTAAAQDRTDERSEGERDETTVTLTPSNPTLSVRPTYDPPRLVPLALPRPPRESTPDDLPPNTGEPDDPFDDTPPELPTFCDNTENGEEIICCSHETGWSFEGSLEGWNEGGNVFTRGPVFGNNVHIDRMLPDGYSSLPDASPELHVGGDYWAFSRDVNQQGNWWLGSSDLRSSHKQLPGMRIPEHHMGWASSPLVRLDSDFIRFFIGGNASFAERVQLEVLPFASETEADLEMLYDGIGVSEMLFAAAQLPLAATHPGAVVVRASGPENDQEFMHRRVAWDVSELRGRLAWIVVFDGSPSQSLTAVHGAHVNVDEVICTDKLDDRVTWNVGEGVAPAVGQSYTPIPLWGTTDTHTHPLVNIAFGGNLMWGDIADELEDVYDCSGTLPEIKSGGKVMRAEKGQVPSADCSSNAYLPGLVAGLPPVLPPPPLPPVPDPMFEGFRWTIVDKLNHPLVRGNSLHGSPSPLSGGLTPYDNLDGLVHTVGDMLNIYGAVFEVLSFKLLDVPDISGLPIPSHIHGLIERLAWDLDDGHHSQHNIKGHQFAQKDMIRRAWQGGLRLMGIDVIDNRTITRALDLDAQYDEWQTIEDTVVNVKRLVACDNDPDGFDKGPLCDIAGIAMSPSDARMLIEANKIAIVLGVETDELGYLRNSEQMERFGRQGETDDMEKQVADLWSIGIRKVNAIHAMDNPLGGAAVFNDTYLTGTNELTNELDEHRAEQAMFEVTLPGGSATDPPGAAMKRWITDWDWLGDGTWMRQHAGWFGIADSTTSWIGDEDTVTFHFGFESMVTPLARADHMEDGEVDPWYHHEGTWKGVDEVNRILRANTLIDASASSMCAVEGAVLPLPVEMPSYLPGVTDDVPSPHTPHLNERGLSAQGETYVLELMKRGMMIDLDHLSQRAREDAWDVAASFGETAALGQFGNPKPGEYPFMAVHTGIRHLTRHGVAPDLPSYRADRGYRTEDDRTVPEFERSRLHGGTFSPAFNASHLMDSPELDEAVRNDCDYSSKTFALKYLWMVDIMGGKGITPSTDMSPFFKPAAPRYGQYQCHMRTSWRDDMFDIDDDKDHLQKMCAPDFGIPLDACRLHAFPKDWDMPGPNAGYLEEKICPIWGRMIPGCKTHDMLQHQLSEGSGVEYEDYFVDANEDGKIDRLHSELGAGVQVINARRELENRDDGAPRAGVDELVGVGGSRQMWLMKKMKTNAGNVGGNTGWDVNLDGMVHIGLMPDFIQDVRNVGVSWERLTPMFNAAEDYVRMWERQCELANEYAASVGSPPLCVD